MFEIVISIMAGFAAATWFITLGLVVASLLGFITCLEVEVLRFDVLLIGLIYTVKDNTLVACPLPFLSIRFELEKP